MFAVVTECRCRPVGRPSGFFRPVLTSLLFLSQEDTSDWLLTDKVSSWPGTPADRGWRYLRHSLQQHDNADTDYKYTKAALETILAADRSPSPPPWLVHRLEVWYTVSSPIDVLISGRNIITSTSFESVCDTKISRMPLSTH